MTQQGKQMRVGAGEGFTYNAVKLALLANSNKYDVDSNERFYTVMPSVHLKSCPVVRSQL